MEDSMKRVRSQLLGRGNAPLVPVAVFVLPLLAFACTSAKEERVPFDPPGSVKPAPGPQPDFGPVVKQDDPPPPISGGTIAIDPSGKLAVASDADRDRVYVVDLPARAVRHTVQLPPHSEPGRVSLVALRSSGEVATIDLGSGNVGRQAVCSAPRGVAYDKTKKAVLVACAGGELVTIPQTEGSPIKRTTIGSDLRDIIFVNGRTYLT